MAMGTQCKTNQKLDLGAKIQSFNITLNQQILEYNYLGLENFWTNLLILYVNTCYNFILVYTRPFK